MSGAGAAASSSLGIACQGCGAAFRAAWSGDGGSAACPGCGRSAPLRGREDLGPEGAPLRCLVCGGEPLYAQKDFNRTFGLAAVLAGAGVALLLGALRGPLWFFATLLGVTLLDAALYRLLPVVAVCYRCQTVHRGFPPSPRAAGFDLETSEWAERQFTLEMEKREREDGPRAR